MLGVMESLDMSESVASTSGVTSSSLLMLCRVYKLVFKLMNFENAACSPVAIYTQHAKCHRVGGQVSLY
jgi:hypothetical protein